MRQIGRRTLLKSLSAGAGGLAFAPLLNKLAAQEAGTYKTPKRVVFVLFGNGFHEPGSLPKELPAPTRSPRRGPGDVAGAVNDWRKFL